MKFFKKLSIYGTVLVITGLVGILPSGYYWLRNQLDSENTSIVSAEVATPLKETPDLITDTPVKVIIGSLRIRLPVIKGHYDPQTKEWTLSDSNAYYASLSTPINNKHGGTLIYGHSTDQVFKSLRNLDKGDRATVITKNGYQFTYQFDSSQTFNPNDSSALAYDGPPRLFLQNCSGSWSQNRQMFYFDLVQYNKIKSDNSSVRDILKDLTTQFITPANRTPSLDVILKSS